MKLPSGRFVLRMPRQLHAQLKNRAKERGLSLNELCLELLSGTDSSTTALLPRFFPPNLLPILERIRDQWSNDAVGIVLFGSTARAEASQNSDIDLLIVLRPGVVINRELYRNWDKNIDFDRNFSSVSPQFVTLPQQGAKVGSLWLEVALEGIVLWETAFEVSRLLISLRGEIIAGKYVRMISHGQSYWTLAKDAA